jgi:branched-chain amino acid transport system substrate-binding protein
LAVWGLASGATLASANAVHHTSYNFVRPIIKYPADNFVQYVIGTKGRANPKLSTIYIGWINQQNGTNDIAPEATLGAEDAVDYMNADTSGLDGHPVKLLECFVPDTVAAASSCGTGFSDNKKVVAVSVGQLSVGNQALNTALDAAHLPTTFILAAGANQQYKPGFSLNSDIAGEAGQATFAKYYLHATSASLIYDDTPGSQNNVNQITQGFQLEHIPLTVVSFDPSTTDLVPAFIAANAGKTSVLLVSSADDAICSDDYLAYKQLGLSEPVISAVPCNTAPVAQGDGGSLPNGWYYLAFSQIYQDPSDPSGPALAKAMGQFGNAAGAIDAWEEDAFNEVMTEGQWISEVLHAGAPLTIANVTKVAKQFKGPIIFGPPVTECGHFTDYPAICGDLLLIEQIFSSGKVKSSFAGMAKYSLGGGWVLPPKGFVVPPPAT